MLGRIRKVKCDETRPFCRRCSTTGRKCDGYQPIQSLQLSLLTNPQELRSYQYFWKKVLPVLSSHWDHLFWGTWVRRACFIEPAIQHAMVAVGALHESIASKFAGNWDFASQQHLLSMQQYNKAIKHLTDNPAQPLSTELVLTSCIVFIAFENLYGHNGKALKHLQSGLAVLQLWKPLTSSEIVLQQDCLTPIYTRGHEQIRNHRPARLLRSAQGGASSPIRELQEALNMMPTTFEDLQAARKHLQILWDIIHPVVDSLAVSGDNLVVYATILHARTLLEGWFIRFLSLTQSPKDNEQRRATILLRLQFETAMILLTAISSTDECQFDAHLKTFQVIISQCEQLVALNVALTGDGGANTPVFIYSFDLSILPSLSITALKC